MTEEYQQLALTGLSFHDVLAMLTTNPAVQFKVSSHAGSIGVGGDGDLTILAADPAAGDLQNFSNVAYTIRVGKVIFERGRSPVIAGCPKASKNGRTKPLVTQLLGTPVGMAFPLR